MAELTTLASESPEEYGAGALIDDRYRLERPLGEGGQAFVWQARHVELDAPVAIKIAVGARDEPERGARLLLEGRSVSKIGHPAIAKVFDVGRTAAGDPFLVMELLEGETLLTATTRAGRLSPVETVRILLPIAHALAAAHAEGLVHRDVKPENVFLARTHAGSGLQPKLLDFGVVKVLDRRREGITAAGAIVGSPAFLSPEQARGEATVDERSDAWSYCVTIYLCLTGRLPFASQTYHRLVRSILEDEPTSIVELGVDEPALWSILRRGLAKSIDERWPTMRDLGAALSGWLLSKGIEKDICDNDVVTDWHGSEEPKSRIVLRADAARDDAPASRRRVPWRALLAVTGAAAVAGGSLSLRQERAPATSSLTPVIARNAASTAAAIDVLPLPPPPSQSGPSTRSRASHTVLVVDPAVGAPRRAPGARGPARARSGEQARVIPLAPAAEPPAPADASVALPEPSRAPSSAAPQTTGPLRPEPTGGAPRVINQDLINPYDEEGRSD